MKYQNLLTLIVMLSFGLLAACAGGQATPTVEPADSDVEPTPTTPALVTVPSEEPGYPEPDHQDSYPAPAPDSGYPAPELPQGYPEPDEPPSTSDPYPGGLAFIIKPVGIQCEEYDLPDLEQAISELEDAGIIVTDASEQELVVCTACGCPTSLHYTARIDPDNLELARSLGWETGG